MVSIRFNWKSYERYLNHNTKLFAYILFQCVFSISSSFFLNFKMDILFSDGVTYRAWTWPVAGWPSWRTWIDCGLLGAMMAWRIFPRWVLITFQFFLNSIILFYFSGWNVQPRNRFLVICCKYGVSWGRGGCWGHTHGVGHTMVCRPYTWCRSYIWYRPYTKCRSYT